jgi:hypothetical protein
MARFISASEHLPIEPPQWLWWRGVFLGGIRYERGV